MPLLFAYMSTIKLTLHGRVQGVGFRYFVKQQAEKYKIKGYVKNLPGNRMGIMAQSEDNSQLNQFLRECKRGPVLSKVEKDEEEEVKDARKFREFEVRV